MTDKVFVVVATYYDESEIKFIGRTKNGAITFCNEAYGPPVTDGWWVTKDRRSIDIEEHELHD